MQDLFLYNALIPVLPFLLQERLRMTTTQVQQWNGILLAIYAIAFLLLSLPFAIWADRSGGRQAPLLTGALLAIAACLLFLLGRSTVTLIMARILQGSSSAALWVVGLVVISDTVAPDLLGRTLAWVMSAYSLSGMLSPLIAGVMYQSSGFDAVLVLVLVVAALDALCRILWIVSARAAATPQSDVSVTRPLSKPGGRETVVALFRLPRLWVACATNFSIITTFTAIDVTLAVHVSSVWEANTVLVGIMVCLLQLPGFCLAPLMGMSFVLGRSESVVSLLRRRMAC